LRRQIRLTGRILTILNILTTLIILIQLRSRRSRRIRVKDMSKEPLIQKGIRKSPEQSQNPLVAMINKMPRRGRKTM
jgi:hypothetical protein